MWIILSILLFFQQGQSQSSTNPIWIGNPYLETDCYEIITDFQTTSKSGAANITFNQTYSTPPMVAFAIITYSGNDGLYDQDFYMNTVRVTNTQVQVSVYMQGTTNIRIFYVMYLAVHPDFKYHLNTFNNIQANYSSSTLSLNPINQYTDQPRIFTNQINYTQLCSKITTEYNFFGTDLSKNKIAVYLSGIFNYVKSQTPRAMPQIKFDITTQAINSSFFKLTVQVLPTYRIDLLRLSFVVMDIQNIQTSKQYTIVYRTQRFYFDKDYQIYLQKQFFNDVFIGMVDFNTQSPSCTIDFKLIFEPINSKIVVKKSVPHTTSLFPNCGLKSARLVIFYMKTWFCPVPFYYFNLNTDKCDDYCASYLYGNITARQCRPCPTGCVRCQPSNPNICIQCDSTADFRQLVNGSCQCIDKYFQLTNTSVSCTACNSIVANCKKCQVSTVFQCDQCNQGWYLKSDRTCPKCDMVGCESCISPSQCTICDSTLGYTLHKNRTCVRCPFSCLCDGYHLPVLSDPSTGVQFCTTVCGDGLVRQSQECDDGNSENQDGCSSNCKVQNFWNCSNSDQLTCCTIQSEHMFIKIDDISKTKGQNAFQIKLSLFPHLKFLSAQKLKQSLAISLSGINTTTSEMQVLEVQRIHLKYYYTSDVQKKQCNITIKLQLHQEQNSNCSMTVQTSMLFYPDSSNNLPLMFFNHQNYEKEETIEKVVDIVIYSSYLVLFLSALPCKIIGLQLFGVLQLAYFSLSEIQDLNLMLIPLIELGSSNGYNPQFLKNELQLPNKISYIDYDALFLNNCGFMLGVLIIQVILGLFFYIIAVFAEQCRAFSSLSKRLLKQVFITLLIFNSFNFSFGAGVNIKYVNQSNDGYYLNLICTILSLIIPLVMIFALIFADPKQFGEFKNKFKRQKASQFYFVMTILYRYALGYYISAKTQQETTSLLIIAFSLMFVLYNFINLPFKSTMHNYRANICHLSQFVILIVANYYESMKSSTSLQQKSFIFTPAYINISVIILSLGISFIAVVYQILMFFKTLKNKFINLTASSSKVSPIQTNPKHSSGLNVQQFNQTNQNLQNQADGKRLIEDQITVNKQHVV